jgi:hypothetical protein
MTFLLHIALVINALYSTKYSTQRAATKELALHLLVFFLLLERTPKNGINDQQRCVFAGGQPPVRRDVASAHLADLRLVRGNG